jgi:TolA-binding protein
VQLRLAELYIENQDLDSARKLLARSKPGDLLETRWQKYVECRIYLAVGQDAPALEDFQELLNDPKGLTPALQAGATVGLTEARIALNGREVADDVIESFISLHADSPYLEDMFRRLDVIYAGEDNSSETELQHWAAEAPPRRAALALYYEARSLQRKVPQEKAIRAYTDFIRRYPDHAFAYEAWMQLGELYLDTSRLSSAGDAFEGAMRASANAAQRARAEIAAGNADFAQDDFLHAAETFHDAADRSPDPDLWLEATYDSALAWLHVGNGNYDRFLGDYTALSQRFPESDQRRDLLLEEGLLQARSGDPRAPATLQSFIRDFPDNRRVAEAQLALAELVFADGDMDSASHLLQAAYVSSPSDQSKEQADYLAIFIADSAKNRRDGEVLRLAQQFLDDWPASTLRAQVRMKMGELYFRREDFANAETQFESLAQESPNDPLADKALILAGESSISAMTGDTKHALSLFEQVANGAGPLKLYARQEEALLNAKTGNNKGAVIIYDDILRSKPDTELRLAALCGKADCMIAAASDAAASPTPAASPAPGASPTPAADPFAAAVALYDQVANDPEASAPWRNQALYKKGRCLAKQGFNDKALEAFYDVLNTRSGAAQQQPDFFWFEKAGFDAAAMLEAKAQWQGAILILEKVAQAAGPRGPEAQKAADQLRLEHFVWD